MHFTRKTISESSGLIIKEQWQIRKERLLASPALIIGFTGFMLILLAAVLIPLFSSVDPNAMTVAEIESAGRKISSRDRRVWKRYFYPSDVRSESVVVGGGLCGCVFLPAGNNYWNICKLF